MGEPASLVANALSTDSITPGKLSVRDAFKGVGVLLTGVTGYVGSLVLEHLLRVCPDVGNVYVLIRGKKNLNAKQRLEKLINSGLFNKLWDKPEVLGKIRLVEGDVTLPDLGLHQVDKEEILRIAEYVIHSAAAVALDDPIQTTIGNNYLSTYNVLELCKQMPYLQSYLHVSTAYVSITFPRGSVVKEQIHPLMHGDAVVSHEEVVTELLRLKEKDADAKAKMFMERWNFPNTYCLGKHLAEQLVSDYHMTHFPCAIVRPSLITGVARDPYPGYIGNLAGGAGFAIAFAIGFFERNSPAWDAQGICDAVPGDVVSSIILAASAATAEKKFQKEDVTIFHACTSTSYPLTNYEMHAAAEEYFTKEPPPYCLLWGRYPEANPSYKPNPYLVYLAKMKTAIKVQCLCWLFGRFGKDKFARRLHTGWRAWAFANVERYDMNLFFSTNNVRKLDAMLVDEEKEEIRVLFTPLTSDWSRYCRTYLSGIKTLLLKSAVKDSSNHDFKYIAPCEPPIVLPASVQRRPSTYTRHPDRNRSGVPKRLSVVSSSSMNALGKSLGAIDQGTSEEEFESGCCSESDGNGSGQTDLSAEKQEDLKNWIQNGQAQEQEGGHDKLQ